MIKNLFFLPIILSLLFATTSCHCDHDVEEPYPFKLGWIVCTDGEVMSFCDFVKSDKVGVAIVYYVNPDRESNITGYAVYINDVKKLVFANEGSGEQGTSGSITELDGNENTYAIFSAKEVGSDLAQWVHAMWTYGQSAYIPSVAQLKQIHAVKDYLNPRIEEIGGDILPDEPDDCWYWSSTEVEGQKDVKAWLVSMHSGAMHETPKAQAHKARAVITLYK